MEFGGWGFRDVLPNLVAVLRLVSESGREGWGVSKGVGVGV